MITAEQYRAWTQIHEQGAFALERWYGAAYKKHTELLRAHDAEVGQDWSLKSGRPSLDPPDMHVFTRWWVDLNDHDTRVVIVPSEEYYGAWGAELPIGALFGTVEPTVWAEYLWADWRKHRAERDDKRKERILNEVRGRLREFPDEVRALLEEA